MSYNGVGLFTPRGSGTNGYVQRNFAAVRQKRVYQTPEQLAAMKGPPPRKPNKEILEHDLKRKVENRALMVSSPFKCVFEIRLCLSVCCVVSGGIEEKWVRNGVVFVFFCCLFICERVVVTELRTRQPSKPVWRPHAKNGKENSELTTLQQRTTHTCDTHL